MVSPLYQQLDQATTRTRNVWEKLKTFPFWPAVGIGVVVILLLYHRGSAVPKPLVASEALGAPGPIGDTHSAPGGNPGGGSSKPQDASFKPHSTPAEALDAAGEDPEPEAVPTSAVGKQGSRAQGHEKSSGGTGEPSGDCSLAPAQYMGHIISTQQQESAEACRQSCRDTEDCNAWVYCFDYYKCPAVGPQEIPQHGCQLAREPMSPWGLPSEKLTQQLQPSSYYSGLIKVRNSEQKTFIRMHSAPTPRVVLASGLPPRTQGCPAEGGNLRALLSVLNKQDYARWHSYDFVLTTSTPDQTLHPAGAQVGPWNLLGEVKQILDWTPLEAADWILYIAPDSMVDDISFTVPFGSYYGYDLVIVGDQDKVMGGDARFLDAGVILLRNSNWTRALLADLTNLVRTLPPPPPEEAHKSDPVAQTIVAYLKREGDAALQHVRFESDFCLACDWRNINLTASSKVDKSKLWGVENKKWKLFITRFFDCQFCEGYGMTPEAMSTCHAAFLEHYEFGYCRFKRNELATQRGMREGTPLEHLDELAANPPPAMLELGLKPPPLYNFVAENEPRRTNPVIKAAARHSTPTGQACWEACMAEPACEMWVWCEHKGGCDDAGEWSKRYPYKGCELMKLEPGHKPASWDRGPYFSTFQSGYITGKHPGRNRTASSPLPPATERVVLMVGMSSTPCTTPWGDLLLLIQMHNKADWARLYGYELHLMAETIDPSTRPGAWQKTAMLKQALNTVPRKRAEYLLWMDMDIIIGNMAFTFPFKAYDGKDLVMWGKAQQIKQGDTQGMNSGVMLIRNTEWMRELMEEVGKFGEYPIDWSIEEKLRATLPTYDIGMYEQNALTFLFKEKPELLDEHVVLDQESGINVWYKNLYNPDVRQPAFVIHFAGCQLCTGFHPEKLGMCDNEYIRNYAEAAYRLAKEIERKHMLR